MEGKKRFYLKWPYNVIVYILLVVVLRIFAIPVILLIMGWNKKQQPEGPEGGYCLDRTRKRLARLLWSLLYLLLAAGCGVVFFMGFGEEKTEISDWAVWIVSGGGFAVFVVCFVIETYMDLRDALCPARSRLANSIRSQLPYPDEAPPVEELFAMVDRDIRENGQWFDRVAIGKEWVFGDDVTSIDRIRGVFPRDEIKVHYSNGRRQSARIIELYIVDDRRQIQSTGLRKPAELQAAVNCLRLRAPEAYFASHNEMANFTSQSDEEWQALESSYRRRRDKRLASRAEQERYSAGSNAEFVLIDLQGRRTSRFDRRTVEDQLTGLNSQGDHFALEPVELIPAPGLSGVNFSRLECGITNRGLTLIAVLRTAGGDYQSVCRPTSEQEAWQAFAGLLERKQVPNLSGWQPLQEAGRPRQQSRARLSLSDRTGATRDYDSFTRRDVELAGEGLSSGRYTVVALFAGPRYLYLKAGDQSDGRVTANASRPDPDKLRVFETKCTDRQAREWLLQMSEGTFAPDFSQWKDITKQLEKSKK
ncbi:MAG: hypothetical protein HFF52_03425 [Lawsonibacter sp.]|nr:hypothetical protein [Lawsonibacter sp.]